MTLTYRNAIKVYEYSSDKIVWNNPWRCTMTTLEQNLEKIKELMRLLKVTETKQQELDKTVKSLNKLLSK